MSERETKYAVMDDHGHIYSTFRRRSEAVSYLNSERRWLVGCRLAKIILYEPRKPLPSPPESTP